MGVTLVFCDSFAHYNTAGIPLKWSSAGGAIETDLAHVRTGPQSLRIAAGNSPDIVNFVFPADNASTIQQQLFIYTIGFGWQTSVLSGETICSLIALNTDSNVPLTPAETQFQFVQNSDGSISVFTGNIPLLIASTAAGVLTVGPFWYIEVSIDMVAVRLVITVTDAGGVASTVLDVSGWVTTQIQVEKLTWGGPSAGNHAWVADFYVGRWDTLDPVVIGAPKIYGLSVPNADGVNRVQVQPGVTPPAFDGTSPPFFPQCNSIPQNTALFMSRALTAAFFYPAPMGQAFQFDVSSVPPASVIAAMQLVMLMATGGDGNGAVPNNSGYMGFTGGDPVLDFQFQGGPDEGIVDGPFQFYPYPFDQNPVTAAPWTVAEFTGLTPFQIGPGFQQPG